MEGKPFNCFIVPPHLFRVFWPRILPGLEKTIERSGTLTTPEMIWRRVENEAWQLWIGYVGGEYLGFFLTEYTDDGRGGFLSVPYAYVDPKVGTEDYFLMGLQVIEDFAILLKCHTIILASTRKGYERRVSSAGFVPVVTSYYKRIKNAEGLPPLPTGERDKQKRSKKHETERSYHQGKSPKVHTPKGSTRSHRRRNQSGFGTSSGYDKTQED